MSFTSILYKLVHSEFSVEVTMVLHFFIYATFYLILKCQKKANIQVMTFRDSPGLHKHADVASA